MTYHTDIHNIQTGIFILALLCMLSSKVHGFSTVHHESGFTECLSIGLEGENRIMETAIMATTHISYSSHSSPRNKMIDCFTLEVFIHYCTDTRCNVHPFALQNGLVVVKARGGKAAGGSRLGVGQGSG